MNTDNTIDPTIVEDLDGSLDLRLAGDRVALGNSTTNISFNGTTLTLNGAIVTAANLNLAGFTASISGTTRTLRPLPSSRIWAGDVRRTSMAFRSISSCTLAPVS